MRIFRSQNSGKNLVDLKVPYTLSSFDEGINNIKFFINFTFHNRKLVSEIKLDYSEF